MNKKIIKSKIKSTQSIGKITKTMEMVSVAKMKKAVSAADGFRTFQIESERILNILGAQREKHAMQIHNSAKKTLLIIIGSEKGLCGAYNSNLYRKINHDYKDLVTTKNIETICIGKYAEKISKRLGAKILLSFTGKTFSNANARVTIKNICDNYIDSNYGAVDLIFIDFLSTSNQFANTKHLLPFSLKNIKDKKVDAENENKKSADILDYTFEPNVEEVYEYTIKIILQNVLLGTISVARAAEHAARMMAMKTASDNAKELVTDLKLIYNKARQDVITRELAEISAASNH
jgi:F-type H+-transporting ATPase subunit gamma